jgi:hypothetical protein
MRYRLLAAVVVITTSCSDGPAAFELDNQFPEGNDGALRLTYNLNDDRAPAWSLASDSVYFSAESYPPFAETSGLLLAAPREGGVVGTLFPQGALAQPSYVAPALSPEGDAIAFFEVNKLWRYDCAFVYNRAFPESKPDTAGMLPLLQQAVLRVRPFERTAADAATLTVDFGGRHLDTSRRPYGLPGVTVIEGALYQRQYGYDRTPLFRASWSPDAQRVVFSNGKQLMVWTVGTAAAVPIPNTDDGVWPAWSPDGQWIAFSRLTPGAQERYEFECWDSKGRVVDVYDVTIYNDPLGAPAAPQLQLIRPSGAELRLLGAGEAPAWTPDGGQVVFARSGSLWRSNTDGTSAVLIANTSGAREPAVSPDGAWVAFTRLNPATNKRDVWVAPL